MAASSCSSSTSTRLTLLGQAHNVKAHLSTYFAQSACDKKFMANIKMLVAYSQLCIALKIVKIKKNNPDVAILVEGYYEKFDSTMITNSKIVKIKFPTIKTFFSADAKNFFSNNNNTLTKYQIYALYELGGPGVLLALGLIDNIYPCAKKLDEKDTALRQSLLAASSTDKFGGTALSPAFMQMIDQDESFALTQAKDLMAKGRPVIMVYGKAHCESIVSQLQAQRDIAVSYFNLAKSNIGCEFNGETFRFFNPHSDPAAFSEFCIQKISSLISELLPKDANWTLMINGVNQIKLTSNDSQALQSIQKILNDSKACGDVTAFGPSIIINLNDIDSYLLSKSVAMHDASTASVSAAQTQFFSPPQTQTIKQDAKSAEQKTVSPTDQIALRVRRAAANVEKITDKDFEELAKKCAPAKLNELNKSHGMNALHLAINCKQLSRVKVLLAYGADPNICTKAGQSCIELANAVKDEAIIEVINQKVGVRHSFLLSVSDPI